MAWGAAIAATHDIAGPIRPLGKTLIESARSAARTGYAGSGSARCRSGLAEFTDSFANIVGYNTEAKCGPSSWRPAYSVRKAIMASLAIRNSEGSWEGFLSSEYKIGAMATVPSDRRPIRAAEGISRWAGSAMTRTAAKGTPSSSASAAA